MARYKRILAAQKVRAATRLYEAAQDLREIAEDMAKDAKRLADEALDLERGIAPLPRAASDPSGTAH